MSFKLNYANLDDFLYQTIDKIRANKNEIMERINQCIQKTKKNWDVCARMWFYNFLVDEFCKHFRLDHTYAKKYIFCEKINPLPKNRRQKFFNSGVYPDCAIILDNYSIAIELDHGNKGSQIKTALAKASFSVMLELYDKCAVLFFIEKPKTLQDFEIQSVEKKIINFYKEKLNTELFLI